MGLYLTGLLLLSPMIEGDGTQVPPVCAYPVVGICWHTRQGYLCLQRGVCTCWERCCCLLYENETATRFLQVCAFPSVDVGWQTRQ